MFSLCCRDSLLHIGLKMKKGPVIPFLIEFYRRRLLRLAPMSILVLACAFGLAYFLLPATDF